MGTPSNKDGSTNFAQIINFLLKLIKIIKNQKILFIIKSTVPPYSIDNIFKKIFKKKNNIDFCSNPEFLREGSAWKDFLKSGKIVIGYENENSKKKL